VILYVSRELVLEPDPQKKESLGGGSVPYAQDADALPIGSWLNA